MIRDLIHRHFVEPEIERMVEAGELVDCRRPTGIEDFFNRLWNDCLPDPIPSAEMASLEEYRAYRDELLARRRIDGS